ncbi:MAG TPA: hypothetical protein DCM28_08800 [Phycisphaerales bacterium]|nr:hypothetical protein [Phycisphaerales bacterium]HCD31307.1 hypothetical protein [Phycisphaerales bacterium]|tara:strand:+ start:89429 stop:92953 length:3525 start_codon:yes stop_codon:yes gene_type:complete
MQRRKFVHILMPVIMLFFISLANAQTPAILFDSWTGEADHDYMTELLNQGFIVDAIKHDELTWARLQQYNVLVMVDFPQENQVVYQPGYGPATGPNYQDTLDMIELFLQQGGGVMINLFQHSNRPTFHNTVQKLMANWGAARPMESVSLPEGRMIQHPRLLQKFMFYYTDNVQTSPVSTGVNGVWYPQNSQWCTGGPISVDQNWTVVLRAPADSQTQPIVPEFTGYTDMLVPPAAVSQPALFAIRDLNPGRLAFFHAHPRHHWSSGTTWIHDGVMLDKGLNNVPSDFGKLLTNTWQWLADPSLQSQTLGGATTPADRWLPRLERESHPVYQKYLVNEPDFSFSDQWTPGATTLFKGIVGPQTQISGGAGSVADYAAMAQQKGLSFVIFLEDMTNLTAQDLDDLVEQCEIYSTQSLMLIPGYYIKTNLGNSFFHFGFNPVLVADTHLSADRSEMIIQPKNASGDYISSAVGDYINSLRMNDANSSGFFDFTLPMQTGGMSVYDLKNFSMFGLMLYRDGVLVEDMTDQFLLTNAGTMTGVPAAIHIVDSPLKMGQAVDNGLPMTYAKAKNMDKLWPDVLRWNSQFASPFAFVSSGPVIEHWNEGKYRTGSYAAEPFVTERTIVGPVLRVTSSVGLQEIEIYEGDQLFRRYLPQGQTVFHERLFLSGSLQRNMSVIAKDINGKKAVSFPLRGWNDGSAAIVYCSDHVNDAEMKLFRGPGWTRYSNIPMVQDYGETWDGMVGITQRPLLRFSDPTPRFWSAELGKQGLNLYQTPYLDFCDENVLRCRSISSGMMLQVPVSLNAWRGYGPIDPTPLVDLTGIYTQWSRYQTGTATGYGPMGVQGGPMVTMYEQYNTYKHQMTLTKDLLDNDWRDERNGNIQMLVGEGQTVLVDRDISTWRTYDASEKKTQVIETGQWFAAFSETESNSILCVNYGDPLKLTVKEDSTVLARSLPSAGLQVVPGQQDKIHWWTCYWPIDMPIADSTTMLRWVAYLQNPDSLSITRGARIGSLPGLIDLEPTNHAVELSIPKPIDDLDACLSFRLTDQNPRYSTILWQKTGFVGEGRYGDATNRFRSLGVDQDGYAYFPLYSNQAPSHHWVIGQPIVADTNGQDLFINVVCLKDAQGSELPCWHVSINNPTDLPITTLISQTMTLPGLNWTDTTLTIAAGQSITLVHTATD